MFQTLLNKSFVKIREVKIFENFVLLFFTFKKCLVSIWLTRHYFIKVGVANLKILIHSQPKQCKIVPDRILLIQVSQSMVYL